MHITYPQAIHAVCDTLTADNHLVISANTDEQAQTPVFAQVDGNEFAFYFVRTLENPVTPAQREQWRSLAAKHQVSAYLAIVRATEPAPEICFSLL